MEVFCHHCDKFSVLLARSVYFRSLSLLALFARASQSKKSRIEESIIPFIIRSTVPPLSWNSTVASASCLQHRECPWIYLKTRGLAPKVVADTVWLVTVYGSTQNCREFSALALRITQTSKAFFLRVCGSTLPLRSLRVAQYQHVHVDLAAKAYSLSPKAASRNVVSVSFCRVYSARVCVCVSVRVCDNRLIPGRRSSIIGYVCMYEWRVNDT